MCGNKMTVEGLPLPVRQEHHWSAGSQDILAGKEFLSVFLKSSAPTTYNDFNGDPEDELQSSYDSFDPLSKRDTSFPDTTTDKSTIVFEETTLFDSYIRTSREVSAEESTDINPSSSNLVTYSTSDSPSSEESVIVAVRVSSSVDMRVSKTNQIQPRTKTIYSTSQTVTNNNNPIGVLHNLNSFSSDDSNVPLKLDNNNAQSSVISKIDSDLKTDSKLNPKEPFSDQNSLDESSKNVFLSRQHPSLIARSSKSELNVDEAEPITHNRENRNNRDLSAIQPGTGFPVSFQSNSYPSLLPNLPSSANIPFNLSEFLKSNDKSGHLQPFHHSFIYHDTPQDAARGRSVSYSTLIQAVSPGQEKAVQHHESDENRFTYNDHQGYNTDIQNLNQPKETRNQNHQSDFTAQFSSTSAPLSISSSTSITKSTGILKEQNSNSDNKWSFPFSHPTETSAYSQQLESSTKNNNWPSSTYSGSSTESSSSTAANNNHWGKFFSPSGTDQGQQQNGPANPPKIYGRPEQNYEIDEAVSVHTNGRTHGIQAGAKNAQSGSTSTESPKNDPKDKDKKTGYVVEGRNYRRYRVEEKTPDGFIVGEYGVVSNDDGSLRGVRYTADGSINPSVIYNALMKFLSL